jgi:hypothetical protein
LAISGMSILRKSSCAGCAQLKLPSLQMKKKPVSAHGETGFGEKNAAETILTFSLS